MAVPGSILAPAALLPDGWAQDVLVAWDQDGTIRTVTPDAPSHGADRAAGPVLPGMCNVHSHAFQRSLVGRTQRASSPVDDFWTWRHAMYAFVDRITPDAFEAIAFRLYTELLRHGYTSVAEFHYLHHDQGGRPYDDPAEMSLRIAAAASRAGIGLTLLPVLYRFGGFSRTPPAPGQRRFLHTPDAFEALVGRLSRVLPPEVRLGLAPHSLRAVDADDLLRIADLADRLGPGTPVHIHVGEQAGEVTACEAALGARPVAWLLDHAPVDRRWCLIHATHIDGSEIGAVARSGSVVGLCPVTEADLGDGALPLEEFLLAGGSFAVGSDSHVSVSPGEELRLLLYTQRLRHRRRAIQGLEPTLGAGTALWQAAARGAEPVMGRAVGRIAPGCRADLLVLRGDRPLFDDLACDDAATAFVLSGGPDDLDSVLSGGRKVVSAGRHVAMLDD